MTTLLPSTLGSAFDPARRRRRVPRWVIPAIGVVVLAVAGVGVGRVAFVHHDRPVLRAGQEYGLPFGAMRAVTDGVKAPSRYILVGPYGSQGTTRWSLENDSGHSVTVLGIAGQERQFFTARWIKFSRHGAALSPAGLRRSSPFPLTMPPDTQIGLFVTATKPGCGNGETEEVRTLDLGTVMLGVHHVVRMDLEGSDEDQFVPIDLCSPATALKHVTTHF